MVYVTLNPILYDILMDLEDLKLSVRKRYYIDTTTWKENGSVVNPKKSYTNSFTLRFEVNTTESNYSILVVNMKDCERTRKALPKILKQEDYQLIELTNQLPMHTHSAIWYNNELYLGYGHDGIVRNRNLQDKESELVFGEYFESTCLTLDLTGTPQLQFIKLERLLFLIVYCQHESLLNKCKQDLLSKGIDVKLQSEIELIDKWLDYKNFEKMLEVEKRCNQKQSTIVSYI